MHPTRFSVRCPVGTWQSNNGSLQLIGRHDRDYTQSRLAAITRPCLSALAATVRSNAVTSLTTEVRTCGGVVCIWLVLFRTQRSHTSIDQSGGTCSWFGLRPKNCVLSPTGRDISRKQCAKWYSSILPRLIRREWSGDLRPINVIVQLSFVIIRSMWVRSSQSSWADCPV